MSSVKHIIRFGIAADQQELSELIDKYDTMIINANIMAHSPSSVADFLVKNICNKEGKGYFIDPITYAFQGHLELLHSKPGKNEVGEKKRKPLDRPIKPPFVKLMSFYGDMLARISKNRPLEPEMFLKPENKEQAETFYNNVINNQIQTVSDILRKNDLLKYIESGGEKIKNGLFPELIIAPYFHMEKDNYEKWLSVNIQAAVYCCKNASLGIPVWAQILIGRDILNDRNILGRIAAAYMETDCKGFIIWIDNFDENTAEEKEIRNLIEFLSGLKGRKVYNAFGGFYSILLGHRAIGLIDGVSHGLEYGEFRGGYPVGGGMPSSKYYFLPLHRRLRYSESYDLLETTGYIKENLHEWGSSERYRKEICNCKVCQELMPEYMKGYEQYGSSVPFEIHYKNHTRWGLKPTREEKHNCRFHYMYCKQMEFKIVEKRSLKVILDGLELAKRKFDDIVMRVDLCAVDRWITVLRNFGENNG